MPAFAFCHESDTEEHEQNCNGMGWLKHSESCQYAYDDSDQWLYVVIDTDDRRAKHLLCLHGEDVAYEGTDDDDESGLKPCP